MKKLLALFLALNIAFSSVANATGAVVNCTAHLIDYMNLTYGVGMWTERTAVGVGSDAGVAMASALDDIRTDCYRGTLIVDSGSWLMNTAPTTLQYNGNYIEGQGSQASQVYYNSNTGAAFSFAGTANQGGTGGGIIGLGIVLEDGYPTSTAIGIKLQGDAVSQPDQMMFEDVYMTARGTSYWGNGFYANGTARTSPQGIRVVSIHNLQIFRARITGFYASNMVQWDIDNMGVYVGSGAGNNIYFAGGGTASTNSTQVYARALVASGDLNVTNISKFQISGIASTISGATSATYGDVSMQGGTLNSAFGAHTRYSNP